MENWVVPPRGLQDHNYSRIRRVSARRAERRPPASTSCFCHRNDEDSEHHGPAPAAGRKRKGPAPQHSHQDHVGSRSPIPPDELPQVSSLVPRDQPSTAPAPDPDPVRIHGRSVSEYQQLYHSVVDDMLKYKSARPRPHSKELGLRIKQALWERLGRPSFTETVSESGLVQVNATYGVGVHPPHHDVDVSLEPEPQTQPRKRIKN